MRVLVCQLNPTIGDFSGNADKILSSLEKARKESAELALFSELVISGYPPEDLLMHRHFVEESERVLHEKILPATKGLAAIVGLVRKNPNKGEKPLFNSAAIIFDGKLLGFHDKILLPTYDVFDERRYFEPGREIKLWQICGKKVAVFICEDIWEHAALVGFTQYFRDPVKEVAPFHPDLALNLSSSPYQFQKPELRLHVSCLAAKTLRVPLVMCCQVGGNDQLVFDGYSHVVNGEGKTVFMARGFEEDRSLVDLNRLKVPLAPHLDPMEDLYRALVLGTRDYFYKQGFKKGCLGLSGGIDSAVVACIAQEALGKENVLGISMPSRYSSKGSVQDAEELARNLGIDYLNISIEKPFTVYLELLEPHFQGKPWDVTEENLQARLRGMILMAISNKMGYIVLSTGNKSEMAVGYCTLYGDMAGGLGVISDVAKMQVYALARWINRNREIIPASSLTKAPSAELRANQKDTDSLPEYPVLDAVLQGYVEDFLSPQEIADKHHLSLNLVENIVRRIHLAEYKRRQGPPGIRVSKKAFRVGRRYPIVQKWK